jgi:ADP-heptose:LPS heptosyltransferase
MQYRWLHSEQRFEHEGERLARAVASLGDANPADATARDLGLTREEERTAARCLSHGGISGDFMACSIGTKFPTNDWGIHKWRAALARIGSEFPKLGLVMLGSGAEIIGSQQAAGGWNARMLNLCAQLTPRESAAVLKRALLYVGHDSGPIHLAASVGTPCVGVYSARHKPGIWFPYGEQHTVIYRHTACHGCELRECERFQKMCISSITVDEVVEAMRNVIESRRLLRHPPEFELSEISA